MTNLLPVFFATSRTSVSIGTPLSGATATAGRASSSLESPKDAPKPADHRRIAKNTVELCFILNPLFQTRDSNQGESGSAVVDPLARRHRLKSTSGRYSQLTKAPGQNCEFVDRRYSRTDRAHGLPGRRRSKSLSGWEQHRRANSW